MDVLHFEKLLIFYCWEFVVVCKWLLFWELGTTLRNFMSYQHPFTLCCTYPFPLWCNGTINEEPDSQKASQVKGQNEKFLLQYAKLSLVQ